ncbi:protein trachealess-like [Littorina saxatilis]
MFEPHQGTHILQSLDGFAFILGNDGRFLYISETVSIYLGLSQVEMTGSSVLDYVHQQDHSELAEHLGLGIPQASSSGVPSPGSSDEGSPSAQRCVSPPGYAMNPNPKIGSARSFCIRMKSTLTKRGVHVKSSGYRVVHILAHMRSQMNLQGMGRKGGAPVMGLVGVAMAMPPPTITELKLEHDTFITRMTPDFTLTYCEPMISEHMDLSPDDVTNRSLYDMCHAGDLASLRQSHLDVLGKGQVMTDYYRLMTRSGGYVWVQTCATTLLNGKNADDQNILAITYVLSGAENGHCMMNLWQMCGTDRPTPAPSSVSARAHISHAADDADGDTNTATDSDRKSKSNLSSKEELSKNHVTSPSQSASHGLHGNNDAENDVMSDDSTDTSTGAGSSFAEKNEGVSQDCKNSRRKMERPRKRKRDEMEAGDGEGVSPDSPQSGGGDAHVENKNKKKKQKEGEGLDGRTNKSRDPVNSVSSPEDLSLKSSLTSSVLEAGLKVTSSSSLQTSSAQLTLSSPTLHGPDRDTPAGVQHWQSAGLGSGSHANGSSSSNVTPSTVKELEAVMNRHLPFLEPGQLHPSDTSPPSRLHGSHSRVSNGSLSNSYPAHAAKKSTIQWVGSHSAASSTSSSSGSSSSTSVADAMAASSFLRSLYESRESVIRSCNSSTTSGSNSGGGVKGGVCGEGRGSNQMYEDMAGTLLTPPGADVFKDHPPPFSIPSIVISSTTSHSSSPSPLTSSSSSSAAKQLPGYGSQHHHHHQLARGYPTSALSLTLPCGGLGEAYSMTPPSSVSPQDKLPSPFAAAAAAALAYNESSHNPYGLGRTSMHPSSSSSHPSFVGKDGGLGGGGHTTDYASAKAAYYAMSALSGGHHPGHGGYDVNHNTTATYDQCARPVIPWY